MYSYIRLIEFLIFIMIEESVEFCKSLLLICMIEWRIFFFYVFFILLRSV